MDPEARGAWVPYGPLKGTCSYILNFELSQFIHPAIFYSEKSKKLFSYFPCERVKFFHVVKGLSFFHVVTPLTFPCTAKIQICPHIEEFSLSTYCQLQFSTYRCPPPLHASQSWLSRKKNYVPFSPLKASRRESAYQSAKRRGDAWSIYCPGQFVFCALPLLVSIRRKKKTVCA